MNLDLTIQRMAFREAPALGVAQVLVAKKRADLEHELLLKQASGGTPPNRAAIENTVTDMQQLSRQTVKATERQRLDRLV